MSLELINRSPDIKKLRNEGYEVSIHKAYLVITNVPYVDENKQVKKGTLVSDITIGAGKAAPPRSHVAYFAGSHPCNADGTIIQSIRHASSSNVLGGVRVDHSFSNKPQGGYPDYHSKMTQYIRIISNPAQAIDRKATAKTFKVCKDIEDDSKLVYLDTNSSRSHIDSIADKVKDQKVGIIGLGGTGSYILDKLAKTKVAEIHLFDGDAFLQHNAFRAPGSATLEELDQGMQKVDYYAMKYGHMHGAIIPHDCYVVESNLSLLDTLDFVFISIDRNEPKKFIFERLISLEIPFIDVGMGVDRVDGALTGMLRVSLCTVQNAENFMDSKRISFADEEDEGAYNDNIQIAELNGLNACLAIIKWKKLFGIFHDNEEEYNATYSININSIHNEDHGT